MLSKPTEYAIRALVYIVIQNRKDLRPGFKEIAREINSPEQFTAKILQQLTRAGLINSVRGRGGGFFFDHADKSLSLLSVIRIVEGDRLFDKCGFGLNRCDSANPCPLHGQYLPIREQFYRLVLNESVQSLADRITSRKAVLNRLEIA